MNEPSLNPISGLPGLGPATQRGQGSPGHTVHETAFDPKLVLHIILKRLWLLLAIVSIVPTTVWLYVRRLPPEYQATASMVIDTITPQVLGSQFRDIVDYETGSWWSAREFMETQFSIIRSRSMAQRVAERLCQEKLSDKVAGTLVPALRLVVPGVDCDNGLSRDRAIPVLQGMMSVQLGRDSRVVSLTAEGHTAELVTLVANTYVETYINRNLQARVEASGKAAGWLGNEFVSLQEQITEAEEKLFKFKAENNMFFVNIEDQQTDIMRRRRRFEEELESTQLKLIALTPLRDMQQAPEAEDPLGDVPPYLQDNEVIKKLKTQYMEAFEKRVELTGKYLEQHPLVVAQQMRQSTLRDELRREIGLAIRNARTQYDILLRQEQELRKMVDVATREARELESRTIKYNQLKRNYDRLRRPTEAVGGRETESELASRLRTNNVRILDAAIVPGGPVGPNVRIALLTALGIALIMALALSFVLEFLDATVKTQDDMEKVLHIPFLGMIPHLPEEPADGSSDKPPPKDLFIARHPKSTVAECCRVIRTNLLFMSPDKPARTLLVTSAGPQEGKSMSSISLALTMAQSGSRVLLVDTDMRRPRLHKVFGLPSGGIGLTTVIAGAISPSEAVRNTTHENLFLLPCGPTPPNPAEILQADRFRQVVAELSKSFDKIIFDSPPIGAVTDALVLSQLTDGVILVAKSHKTSRDMLRRAQRQLDDLSATMLGSLLNDLDLESRRKGYGYPYYYYYKSGYYRYGYYSSENEAPADASKDAPALKDPGAADPGAGEII